MSASYCFVTSGTDANARHIGSHIPILHLDLPLSFTLRAACHDPHPIRTLSNRQLQALVQESEQEQEQRQVVMAQATRLEGRR